MIADLVEGQTIVLYRGDEWQRQGVVAGDHVVISDVTDFGQPGVQSVTSIPTETFWDWVRLNHPAALAESA